MKKMQILLGLFFFLSFLISCSEDPAQTPTTTPRNAEPTLLESLKDRGLDRYMGISSTSVRETGGGWKEYDFDAADCTCVYGTPYKISAKKSAGSRNVILFMQGGGACWPEGIYRVSCLPVAGGGSDQAWFSQDAANPLRDWNVIYLPYCDGSVFSGDSDADYNDNGRVDHHHWGFRHLSAGVSLMKKLFPNPEKILVSGSSGGAYGTFLAFGVVRLQYPNTKIYVFNDAGPGLYNPDDPETLEIVADTWKFRQFMPSSCADCEEQSTYLFKWYLERDPQVRIGMFSSYGDEVIGGVFLRLVPRQFKDLLLGVTDKIKEPFPERFNRFFVNGTDHTTYAVGMGYEVEGVSIYDWVGRLTEESHGAWEDLLE